MVSDEPGQPAASAMRAALLRQPTVTCVHWDSRYGQSKKDGHAATLLVNLQQRQGLRQADTAGHNSARRGLPALIGTPTRPHRARQRSSSWHDAVATPSPLLPPGRPVEDS